MNPVWLRKPSSDPHCTLPTNYHVLSGCNTRRIYYLPVPWSRSLGQSLAVSSAQVSEAEIMGSVELQSSPKARVLFQAHWLCGTWPLPRLISLEPAGARLCMTSSPATSLRKLSSKKLPRLCQATQIISVLRSTDLGLYLHLQSPFTAVGRIVFEGVTKGKDLGTRSCC